MSYEFISKVRSARLCLYFNETPCTRNIFLLVWSCRLICFCTPVSYTGTDKTNVFSILSHNCVLISYFTYNLMLYLFYYTERTA